MNEAQALLQLKTNPLNFLRKNSVTPFTIMQAGATVPAGVYPFYMVDASQQIYRPRKLTGNINPKAGQRFKIMGSALTRGFRFNAIHIPVQPSNIPINAYRLNLGGDDLMITTQLTGCCVVMIPNGNTWNVAHLQPTGETGTMLHRRLKAGGTRVYGVNDYSGGRAALVGVKESGKWNFYAQKQDGNFNVVSVRRLK